MLRRPRPAPASHTHTRGAPAGGGEEWDGGPGPGGTQRRVSRGLEGESRTKGCAGCHREVTEGRFATPRTPHLLVRSVGSPGVGGGREVLEGENEDGEDGCHGVGDGNAPRGARRGSVFLVPICSSPFFVAFVSCPFVTVCMDVVWGAISAVGLLINESQVVASSLWMGGARASTGRRIKDPPLFPETWCVCVCVRPMKSFRDH